MTETGPDYFSTNAPGGGKTSRDRRVSLDRRKATIDAVPATGFAFDNRVLEDQPPPAPELPLFHLGDIENVAENAIDTAVGDTPASGTGTETAIPPQLTVTVPLQEASSPPRRGRPAVFWIFSAALLAIGLFSLVHLRGRNGSALVGDGGTPPRVVEKEAATPQTVVHRDATVATTQATTQATTARRNRFPAQSPRRRRQAIRARVPIRAGATLPGSPSPARKDEEERRFSVARKFQQRGDSRRAEELYRDLLATGKHGGRAALALGDLYAEKGDYQRAVEFYHESKRLYRDTTRTDEPR